MAVVTVPLTDLERAKASHGETLGLENLWEYPVSVRFRCGASSGLSIFRRPPIATEHTLAHFEVSDIEAAVRELEAKHVAFIGYTKETLVTAGHIAQLGPARAACWAAVSGRPPLKSPVRTSGITSRLMRA